MRRVCLRTLILLTVLMVTVGISTPARSTTFCFITLQECVRCGPDLSKKCTYYECTDGSTRTTCTQCSLFCAVS
jgi:hypothetical protein